LAQGLLLRVDEPLRRLLPRRAAPAPRIPHRQPSASPPPRGAARVAWPHSSRHSAPLPRRRGWRQAHTRAPDRGARGVVRGWSDSPATGRARPTPMTSERSGSRRPSPGRCAPSPVAVARRRERPASLPRGRHTHCAGKFQPRTRREGEAAGVVWAPGTRRGAAGSHLGRPAPVTHQKHELHKHGRRKTDRRLIA
jgi:hypothetical protein